MQKSDTGRHILLVKQKTHGTLTRAFLCDIRFQRNFSDISFFRGYILSEKKRNAPKSRESYDDVYYSRNDSRLTAEYPRYYIKLKKPYATPVYSAYYKQSERYSIYYHFLSLRIFELTFNIIFRKIADNIQNNRLKKFPDKQFKAIFAI